jgi:hypothetical protein
MSDQPTRPRFYMIPNRLGMLLEDRIIGAKHIAVVVWVGTKFEGTHGGFKTNKQAIASVLGDCSLRTVQRVLSRTCELDLIRHDLRQGQRRDFTIALGPNAVVDPTTLDTRRVAHVQSDFGQGVAAEAPEPQASGAVTSGPTLDSRARKGLSKDVESEPSRRTTRAREDEITPRRGLATRASIEAFEPGAERDFLEALVTTFDAILVEETTWT